MSKRRGKRADCLDGVMSEELTRIIREQEADEMNQAAGRAGAIAKSVQLDDLDVIEFSSEPDASDADDAGGGLADVDDADDAGSEPAHHVDAPGRRPRPARNISEAGTARDGTRHQRRKLLRAHLERLTIIDPFATAVATMRWLYDRSLTIPQIVEMTGRGKSTIEDGLKATGARLLLLNRFPVPDPAATYRPAREGGVPRGAAAFAFWFAYTLSAERAAELSGYGRSGPSAAREHVLGTLAGSHDPRVSAWSASLTEMIAKLKRIRAATTKVPSTTLGKRRSELHPAVADGQMAAPIPWLDQIVENIDPAVLTKYVKAIEDLGNIEARKRKASDRYGHLDDDPVALLAHALEHDPANVITLALALVSRDMPYSDTFRDVSDLRGTRA